MGDKTSSGMNTAATRTDEASVHRAPRTSTSRCYDRLTRNAIEADLSRMVELGTVIHRSRGAPYGATWCDGSGRPSLLERATRYEPSVVEGRFMIHSVHLQRPWIVIVEPDVDAKLLVVVTPYEVSQ